MDSREEKENPLLNTNEDFWNNLPSNVKQDIDDAIVELNQNMGIDHKSVWNEVREKLGSSNS